MKCFVLIALLAIDVDAGGARDDASRPKDEYDPSSWPMINLSLSPAATLKNVFDSGLRPYWFPGLENSLLEVKHLDLLVTLGSGKKLPPTRVELVNITPFADDEIATIEGFTPKLTLAQARFEMLKWLPYAANKRTMIDLDRYLEAVKTDFLDFDDPYHGIADGCSVLWSEPGWKERGGGPQVIAWFRKTANSSSPLRLYFKATWSSNRPIKDRGSYRSEPIAPPAGYENVDMTAPAKFGPDSMADILRSKGVNIGDGKGGIPYNEYLASVDEKRRVPVATPRSRPTPEPGALAQPFNWWWGLLVAFLLAIAFGYRICKSKGWALSRSDRLD